jgi:hypothetical protein
MDPQKIQTLGTVSLGDLAVTSQQWRFRCDQWIWRSIPEVYPMFGQRCSWSTLRCLHGIGNNTRPQVCQNPNVTGVSMYDNSHFLLIKPAVFADFPTRTHHRKSLSHGSFYFHNLTLKQTTRGSRTCPHIPVLHKTLKTHKHFFCIFWFSIWSICIPIKSSWKTHGDSQDLSEFGLAWMLMVEDFCRKWWFHGYLMGIYYIYIYITYRSYRNII